jgi:MFS family permease
MNPEEIQQSPTPKPRFFYGYIVVVAALCIMMVNTGTQSAFGVFFKPMLTDFGWTRTITSSAFSLSMLVSGLSAVVMGRLTDKFGPRLVMTICGLLIGLGYLLMSRISNVWQMYLFYGVIVGVGMGGTFVTLISTVARWFVKRRSMITGIVFIGTGAGALVVPPLATRLILTYDWQTSYIILGVVLLVVVVLASQFLRRDPAKTKQLPYGESKEIEQESKPATDGFSFRDAVYTRQLWQVFAMCICLGFTMFAVMVHIVPHATDLRIPLAGAATIFVVIGAVDIVGRLVMGNAADRIGNRRTFIIGFALMVVALFWLVIAKEKWMFYAFAVAFGFAYSTMGTSISPIAARLFGLRSHGLIYGVAALGGSLGGAVGPLLTGYIFDITGSYEIAFLVCAAIGLVGLMLTVLLRPIRAKTSIQEAPIRL